MLSCPDCHAHLLVLTTPGMDKPWWWYDVHSDVDRPVWMGEP